MASRRLEVAMLVAKEPFRTARKRCALSSLGTSPGFRLQKVCPTRALPPCAHRRLPSACCAPVASIGGYCSPITVALPQRILTAFP